jgi:hypothetical protein
MTPTSDNPSPTPLHEPINAVIDATVKEAVQESSGPEARETPPRSSLLVLHYSIMGVCVTNNGIRVMEQVRLR